VIITRRRSFAHIAVMLMLMLGLILPLEVMAQDADAPVTQSEGTVSAEVVVEPTAASESTVSTPEETNEVETPASESEESATEGATEIASGETPGPEQAVPGTPEPSVSMAGVVAPFSFTSFDCSTGQFGITFNYDGPNAPGVSTLDIFATYQYGTGGGIRHTETYQDLVPWTGAGSTQASVRIPAEGGVQRVTIEATAFSQTATIFCDTVALPNAVIEAVSCATGMLTLRTSAALSVAPSFHLMWDVPSPGSNIVAGPAISGAGAHTIDIETTVSDHSYFEISLFVNQFRVELVPCSVDIPNYYGYLPAGPNAQVDFDVYQGFVGDTVQFTVEDFPPFAPIQIVLASAMGGPVAIETGVTTNNNGDGSGTFVIPDTYSSTTHNFRAAVGFTNNGGPAEFFALDANQFEVKSKLTAPSTFVAPGGSIELTLTGGSLQPYLDVRFYSQGSSYSIVATIVSPANNGRNVIMLPVPNDASNGVHEVRVSGASANVNVFRSVSPDVTLNKERTTVNSNVGFTLVGFPVNTSLTVTWKRPGGSTVVVGTGITSAFGEASGTIKVPATEGGIRNSIIFSAGATTVTEEFDVAPRIKLIPGTGTRGGTVEVSLRGYTKNEPVRIRWQVNGSWVLLATVSMSNTGSANINVTIPSNAPIGPNSVRGDGTVWRQQTNSFIVLVS
jgi:hypothetical protein